MTLLLAPLAALSLITTISAYSQSNTVPWEAFHFIVSKTRRGVLQNALYEKMEKERRQSCCALLEKGNGGENRGMTMTSREPIQLGDTQFLNNAMVQVYRWVSDYCTEDENQSNSGRGSV